MRLSLRLAVGLGLGLGLALTGAPAHAGPEGEARSLLRDADRPYTVVAGEADASAVVQNPANLSYLQGFNAILDFAAHSRISGRRGSGVGLFLAVPLPWDILALGVGIQGLWREQVSTGGSFAGADDPFGKFTIAASVPLMRWAPGLSVGLQYSRLFSGTNTLAMGVNQFDLALSWRANRFFAMGLVARNLNAPRLEGVGRALPVLDPELALRPLGDPRLELAFGMRVRTGGGTSSGAGNDPNAQSSACGGAEPQIRGCVVQPRGRVLLGTRGVRVYAEVEGVAYFQNAVSQAALAARFSTGLVFDTPHFGAALGPATGAGMGDADAFHGGSGRIRLSHERYAEVLPVRPRRVTRISLASKRDDRDLAEVVWTIDELARRRGGVILVELRGTGLGVAQLEEVREALLRYQDAGGKVVVYLEGASLSHYFLASVGDRVISHPHVALSIIGLATRTFYWAELLERLGIRAEFVRIAEYKGRPEQFSRTGPSAPVAEANRALLTDIWNHLVRSIGYSRARDPAVVSGWVDAAPWQPDAAIQRGLIDDVAWPDELDAKLEAWLGRSVRIEAPPKAALRPGDWRDPAHVAVVHVHGTLVTGESVDIPLLRMTLAGSATLTKTLAALRDDRDVKAIVVRIDSPGGSVRAASDIARELDRTRERKPVVISMGRIAASGGYYIATAGQYIFADATTVTGAIGIFYPKLDLSGFLTKFGVHAELLSIGDRATLRSYWKPYSDDERAAALAGIQASYDLFIDRVARARAMSSEDADAVARGRIWSGVRATEVGLVDRYGGLREAVDRAARMADLNVAPGAAPAIRHYPPEPTILQQIRTVFGLNLALPLGSSGGAQAGLGGLVQPTVGRALGFADPVLRTLGMLPAALWYGDGPEALAIAEGYIEIDG